MSEARSNLFVFTDKRLMKTLVIILTEPCQSAACSNRLFQAYARLILAGLVLWFLIVTGMVGGSCLCLLTLLIFWPCVAAISTSGGPVSSSSIHQPCLMSFKLRSVSKEWDITVDALKYSDPEFTRDINIQIADNCNKPLSIYIE